MTEISTSHLFESHNFQVAENNIQFERNGTLYIVDAFCFLNTIVLVI